MSAIEEYGKRKEQKGFEIGKREVRKEIFKKVHDSGMSVEEIARRTGIDIKEVEELLD